jgi:hypothetical protein
MKSTTYAMLNTSIIAIAPIPAEAYSGALLGCSKLARKPTENMVATDRA